MAGENLIAARIFCEHHQVEFAFIESLQEYGLLQGKQMQDDIYIDTDQLKELERLTRLHYELDINYEGLDAVLHLQKQMEQLREEMRQLRQKLALYESNT